MKRFIITLLLACIGSAAEAQQKPARSLVEQTARGYAWQPPAAKATGKPHLTNTAADEADEPDLETMTKLAVENKDLDFYLGGKLKDEFYFLNRCYTLRNDYGDQNDFFRHKMQLDTVATQGAKKYGRPASQATIRLTNYVLWQDEAHYTPMYIEQISLPDDGTVLTRNVPVKTIVPLVFVEEAWFKLHLDTFAAPFKDGDTFLKIGYFPYQLGRGLSMGVHEDLAVDYLGWGGEGGFTRYPFMPPGILFHHAFNNKLSMDAYFNLWRETNASISDTLQPTRRQRLVGPRPERRGGKDTWSLALRADYLATGEHMGSALVQPYAMYTNAPEQSVEAFADASSQLLTMGTMVDWKYNNWTVNVEVALQLGHQKMHALDRNDYVVGAGGTGALSRSYSHLLVQAAGDPNLAHAPTGETDPQYPQDQFDPTLNLDVLVNNNDNGTLEMQGQQLRNVTVARGVGGALNVYNSNIFGNKRFRPAYRLNNRGLMVMADVVHDVQRIPVVLAGALGYISGDAYPYNDETSRNFYGFIPQRSRYRGYGVKSFLVFDRLVIPRPLNISYRTLYAYNDLKDLSNLKFLGFGATWFPWEKRSKGHLGLDVMFLAEVAKLYAWDVNGRHPDAAIETQLVRLRNTFAGKGTLFRGWQSSKRASKYLGYEVDLRAHYELLDHCDAYCRFSLFVPGQLYKDLDGQPNILTRRTDDSGFARYDTLGSSTALGIMLGMQYRF